MQNCSLVVNCSFTSPLLHKPPAVCVVPVGNTTVWQVMDRLELAARLKRWWSSLESTVLSIASLILTVNCNIASYVLVGRGTQKQSPRHWLAHAISQCMGAAIICLAWMSSAVLYGVVSQFLTRPFQRKCYSVEQEDLLRPLFKAIVYSRSQVRKCEYTCKQLISRHWNARVEPLEWSPKYKI